MLSQDEKNFLDFWENQRIRRKKVVRQLSVGLPIATLLIITIIINAFSGWYKRADMDLHADEKSLIPVLAIAALGIGLFIVIFSARHRWDMNEQRYKELRAREKMD